MSTAVRYTTGELREITARAAVELDRAPAEQIVEWAVGTFGERFCVTSSFADAVLVHLVASVAQGIEVIFLDTGLHFAETLRVRDTVQRTLPVIVKSVEPRMSVGRQDAEYGPRLFSRAPDECCAIRKVEPLNRALRDYDAWATGLRRDVKGLYSKAFAGVITAFTGVSDPYEAPLSPDLVIDTERETVADGAARVVAELRARGHLRGPAGEREGGDAPDAG